MITRLVDVWGWSTKVWPTTIGPQRMCGVSNHPSDIIKNDYDRYTKELFQQADKQILRLQEYQTMFKGTTQLEDVRRTQHLQWIIEDLALEGDNTIPTTCRMSRILKNVDMYPDLATPDQRLRIVNFARALEVAESFVWGQLDLGAFSVSCLSGIHYHLSQRTNQGCWTLSRPFTDALRDLKELCDWIIDELDKKVLHPIEFAAIANCRFARIKPFTTWNDQIGRILMNMVLFRHNYPPMFVQGSQKDEYIKCLTLGMNSEDYQPFVSFMAQQTIKSYDDAIVSYDWLLRLYHYDIPSCVAAFRIDDKTD